MFIFAEGIWDWYSWKCISSTNFKEEETLWIELPWPENTPNTYARDTETLDSCFDLIRSHQQCILQSPPLEIEPATTDCSAETLQLSHQFTSHTNQLEITVYTADET